MKEIKENKDIKKEKEIKDIKKKKKKRKKKSFVNRIFTYLMLLLALAMVLSSILMYM